MGFVRHILFGFHTYGDYQKILSIPNLTMLWSDNTVIQFSKTYLDFIIYQFMVYFN